MRYDYGLEDKKTETDSGVSVIVWVLVGCAVLMLPVILIVTEADISSKNNVGSSNIAIPPAENLHTMVANGNKPESASTPPTSGTSGKRILATECNFSGLRTAIVSFEYEPFVESEHYGKSWHGKFWKLEAQRIDTGGFVSEDQSTFSIYGIIDNDNRYLKIYCDRDWNSDGNTDVEIEFDVPTGESLNVYTYDPARKKFSTMSPYAYLRCGYNNLTVHINDNAVSESCTYSPTEGLFAKVRNNYRIESSNLVLVQSLKELTYTEHSRDLTESTVSRVLVGFYRSKSSSPWNYKIWTDKELDAREAKLSQSEGGISSIEDAASDYATLVSRLFAASDWVATAESFGTNFTVGLLDPNSAVCPNNQYSILGQARYDNPYLDNTDEPLRSRIREVLGSEEWRMAEARELFDVTSPGWENDPLAPLVYKRWCKAHFCGEYFVYVVFSVCTDDFWVAIYDDDYIVEDGRSKLKVYSSNGARRIPNSLIETIKYGTD